LNSKKEKKKNEKNVKFIRKVSWTTPNIGNQEEEAVLEVVKSGWMTQGRQTELFEKEICDYIGCKNAIVVNNGTAALIAALLAHGINKNDEVIVPSYTFIATVNSVLLLGAKPILVDCDKKTFNVTPQLVEEKITKKTKAIIVVDYGGMPVDIDSFRDLSKNRDVILIEDGAQSIGAQYKHKKVGNFDYTTTFSFHMAKLCTTIEGGCVLTNDNELAQKVFMVRNHGMQKKYEHKTFGLNLRINDIQSAIGRVQLKKIEKHLELRNKLAKMYIDQLNDKYEFQHIPDYVTRHPWMLFGLLTNPKERDELNQMLNNHGIETRICYKPTHTQEYHRKLFPNLKLPNTDFIASRVINLPMGNAMKEKDAQYVIDTIQKFKK